MTHPRKRRQRQGYRVVLYGETYVLQMRDLGPRDEALVRQTTGRPLTSYLNGDGFGLDSLGIIIWICRRKAGERKLTLSKVFDGLPTYGEWTEMIDDGRADFEQLDDVDEAADDEAESIIDVDEVDTHPLPHDAT